MIEVLDKFFDSPEKWTQYGSARDKNDHKVDTNSKDAVCWCLYGALDHLHQKYIISDEEYENFSDRLDKATKGSNYINFNDKSTTKFSDVKQLIAVA